MIAMETSERSKSRGRPLTFNRDDALEQAMLLFWKHGYESTSVGDLTKAMGITAPSLYAAFGNKKQLFLEAVDRYLARQIESLTLFHDATTAREAAHHLLLTSATLFTGSDTPAGCLVTSATISCSSAAEDVQIALREIRKQVEAELLEKIEHDVAAGKLGPEPAARPLAALCMAVVEGMSTLARDGATRSELIAVAEAAMRAWPPTPY